MNNITVCNLKQEEVSILEEFIYQAIFQKDSQNPIPRSIINDPTIAIYINDFGSKLDDNCLVAKDNNEIIGAVWTRLLNGTPKGFGNIDSSTPEFAISVLPEYRGKGIGLQLMSEMLSLLKEKGYKQTSLAVQKDNYAVNMYTKVGFQTISENEEEYIMLRKL